MKRLTILFLATLSLSLYGAKKETFFAYRSFWPESAAMRAFGEAGIDTYAVMPSNSYNTLGEPYCKFPPFWVWDETYLWNVVDEQFDLVIHQNPRAKFIVMIDVNSPLWLTRRLDRKYGMGGDSYAEPSNSLCIKEWRDLTEKMIKAYVNHMEERYGDRVYAYMIAGGGTSEWYCCAQGRAVPQKEELWEKWLKDRNLPNWEIPTHKRIYTQKFLKEQIDPATHQDVIEYARFTENIISQGVEDLQKIVRDIVGDKRQVGAFCGFSPKCFSGKLDNRMTFSSPTSDFVGSPGGYDNRALGQGGGATTPIKSVKIRGKHYFQEIDHRTHTYNADLTPYVKIGGIHLHGAKNQAESDAILKREFAHAIIWQNSLWCFDMWGGIFKTPETMEIVKKSYQLWKKHQNDTYPISAEVVLITDPESGFYSQYLAYSHIKKAISTIGAPYEAIFFDDIEKVDFSKYKMVVFPHSFEITPKKKELLDKYVFKDNKTVVTMRGFGVSDGKTLDESRTEKLVGFPFAKSKTIQVKQMNGWKSVYNSNMGLFNKNNLQQFAREAGVHIYIDATVPVYANDKLIAIHTIEGGKRMVNLPRKVKQVKELYSDKIVAENTDKFEYEFKKPDTALFELID